MSRPLVIEAEPAYRTERANPYNALLYRAMDPTKVTVRDLSYWRLLTRRIDVVHLHWPELTFLSGHRTIIHVARLWFFYSFLRVARLRGTTLIWTVHNVTSHEERSTPRIRARHQRLLLREVDAIVALTRDGLRSAREAYPALAAVPGFVTPHGHYRDVYDFGVTRELARSELRLGARERIVLAVGQIRPYRNIPRLIDLFSRVDDPAARLVVAGRARPDLLEEEIRSAAGADDRVRLELEFLSADRIALWLRAADLVVLPYTSIQNSGSAILSLSADRPVLVPALGAMRELAQHVGAAWVRTYDGDLDEDAIRVALDWATDRSASATVDLADMEWSEIAATTVSAYHQVVGR